MHRLKEGGPIYSIEVGRLTVSKSRAQARTATPIIALTASALREEQVRSLEAGCDLHVAKPVKKARVIQAIHQVVMKRGPDRPTGDGLTGLHDHTASGTREPT